MNVPPTWYGLAVVITLLNGSVLGFLARREKNRALASWALAWIAWGAAAVPLAALGSPEAHPVIAVLCGLLWVISALGFLRGAHLVAARDMARGWYAVAAACALLALGLGVGPGGAAGMVPLVLFQSLGLVATGVVIIRGTHARAGAWTSGGALIALGVHMLDAPVLATQPQLFLWGFALAIALQMLAALGMLVLYYEHARAALAEAQTALEDRRRIEALGHVAGGVAHDFNNMLTVMQGHLSLIRLRDQPGDATLRSLDAIDDAVGRAGRLTKQLLAFGRRSVLLPQAVDVRAVTQGTLELLDNVIPDDIAVELSCGPGDYRASMDRALLEQIVLNLVINARDAITGDGRIAVELERVDLPAPALSIRVRDDGEGMDETLVGRVFEPFFTSKPAGRGTGLGLASVQGAVDQLGGEVRVESAPGHGSTFEVRLPWTATGSVAPTTVVGSDPRVLRVLVVDDDDDVRGVTAEILRGAGHEVAEAGDGPAALAMVEDTAYDLVVSDVVMPRMGGVELRGQIAKARPSTVVLLTSGHPLDDELDTRKTHFLSKPFGRDALLEKVARLTTLR